MYRRRSYRRTKQRGAIVIPEKMAIMLELTFRSGFAKGVYAGAKGERVNIKQIEALFEQHLKELDLQVDRMLVMQSEQKEVQSCQK